VRPVKEPQQDRSRATREALLEAAVSCLATVGWSGSTVTVVAERAGVSRGAAQHHFPTREDLFIAAVEHVSDTRAGEITRSTAARGEAPISTLRVVQMVVELHMGELFRAALQLWVASSAEPQLRTRVVPLEARIGRQVHRATVQLLGVDDSVAGVRELIQATLDMARGLGLANLLTDDRRRREPIVVAWAAALDAGLAAALDPSLEPSLEL
jgi:AcrR family transcriptional regulator